MADQKVETEEKVREVPMLTAARMVQAEHKRTIWHFDIPSGTDPGDMATVAYWSHVAHNLRQFDVLECWCEDGSWFAECRVLDAGHNWAKVTILRASKLEAFKADRRVLMLPGHRVEFAGNFARWRVIREADGKVIKDKFNSEGDAYTWVSEYAKSVAA